LPATFSQVFVDGTGLKHLPATLEAKSVAGMPQMNKYKATLLCSYT